MSPAPPRILCLSGHDPGGGAGVHADIEAVGAHGGHALSVITALTLQDSINVREVRAVEPVWIAAQLALLEADGPIAAVKIGLLGDATQIPVIAACLDRLGVPVVLDPVLRAGGGRELAGAALQAAVLDQLLPRVHLLTPNAAEARRLAPDAASLDDAAACLLDRGCRQVLITGGDEPDDEVRNRWYRPEAPPQTYRWPRLPTTFHGAGCTLASAIAARLGRGEPMAQALAGAQAWTQDTLARARRVGRGRPVPGRVTAAAHTPTSST